MITNTMTYAEAANEMRLELPKVVAKMYHLNDDFVRRAKKAKRFPYEHSYFYNTPGGNQCVITFLCDSKKGIENSRQSIHYVWESQEGKTIGQFLGQMDVLGVVQIFTPHCLHRVRTRLFNDEPMTDEEFILAFINSFGRMITVPVNKEICANEDNLSTDSEAKAAMVATPGVFFGSVSEDSLEIVTKTFLTYDMLHPNQYEALKEAIDDITFSPSKSPLWKEDRMPSEFIHDLGMDYKSTIKENLHKNRR